jgi:hypothetical protein
MQSAFMISLSSHRLTKIEDGDEGRLRRKTVSLSTKNLGNLPRQELSATSKSTVSGCSIGVSSSRRHHEEFLPHSTTHSHFHISVLCYPKAFAFIQTFTYTRGQGIYQTKSRSSSYPFPSDLPAVDPKEQIRESSRFQSCPFTIEEDRGEVNLWIN